MAHRSVPNAEGEGALISYGLPESNPVTKSVPRPMRDVQIGWHVFGGTVVAGHRGRRCPREIFVERLTKPIVTSETHILECLVETGDTREMPSLVRSVATVNPHYRGFVVRSDPSTSVDHRASTQYAAEALGVIGSISMAERVAHHFILPRPVCATLANRTDPRTTRRRRKLSAPPRFVHDGHLSDGAPECHLPLAASLIEATTIGTSA